MRPYLRFFVFRLGLFLLPAAALFAFPAWVLGSSGELLSVERIVELQQGSASPVTVGLAYSNPDKYFKLRSFLARRPAIAVFGNSHVMSMRADSFGGERFYNAAVGGSRLPDFRAFVEHIPAGAEPKTLMIGLDPIFAKPDYDWSRKGEEKFDPDAGPLTALRVLGSSWKKVYRDYFSGKFGVSGLRPRPPGAIGVEAAVHGSGYLKDGSHLDAKARTPFSGEVQDYSRLKDNESFDDEGMRYVEDFLQLCRERGIHVIGFLPPAREAVYRQLSSSGYRYWDELPRKLAPVFERYGFEFYDLSHPSLYGGNDDEFDDDFHASEEAFRRIAGLIPWERGLK